MRLAQPGRWREPVPGISLLDLVIALAIAAILFGLAMPSYHRSVQRADRADAIRRLLAAAACEERVRAGTGHYDTTLCSDDGNDVYTIGFTPPDEAETPTYSVIATPRDPNNSDACGSLGLDQAGNRSISGPDGSLAACWGGR